MEMKIHPSSEPQLKSCKQAMHSTLLPLNSIMLRYIYGWKQQVPL